MHRNLILMIENIKDRATQNLLNLNASPRQKLDIIKISLKKD